MKKRNSVLALAASAAAALAIGVPVVASADEPGETVEIKSTITANVYVQAGKVTASNPNCVEERKVVIKQKGKGLIGETRTNAKGAWKAEPQYKGSPPLKVWAEVKPETQGTAGTIYKCLGAKSNVKTINGG